ncbi:MAG: NTP transferase domain-containing protein [Myxococcota bacterium]
MSVDQSTLAIVTAAGRSARMGRTKALLDWGGIPLVRAHVRALEVRCRVVVVVGWDADRVAAAAGSEVARNRDWATGTMIDSIRVGLGHWRGDVLVQPVDTVPVSREVLNALVDAPGTTVPLDVHGNPGHPVRIGPADVGRLATVGSLRELTAGATRLQTTSAVVGAGFNTPAEYAAVVARAGR